MRCSGSTWNLLDEVLNDQATAVFPQQVVASVNALSCKGFPMTYLFCLFLKYRSLLTLLALPAHVFPVSFDIFSVIDSLNMSRFQSLGLFSSRLTFGEGGGNGGGNSYCQ